MQRIWVPTPRHNLAAGSPRSFTNFGGTLYELDTDLTNEEQLHELKRICVSHGVPQRNWKWVHVFVEKIEDVRLENCTVKYLKDLCSYLGVAGYSRMSAQELRDHARTAIDRLHDHIEARSDTEYGEVVPFDGVEDESPVPGAFPEMLEAHSPDRDRPSTENGIRDDVRPPEPELTWPMLSFRDRGPRGSAVNYPSVPDPELSSPRHGTGNRISQYARGEAPRASHPLSPLQLEGPDPIRSATPYENERLHRENLELSNRIGRLERQLDVSSQEQSREVHSLQEQLQEQHEEMRELRRRNDALLLQNRTLEDETTALQTQSEVSRCGMLRSQSQVTELEAVISERERLQAQQTSHHEALMAEMERDHRRERGQLEQALTASRQDNQLMQRQLTDSLQQRLLRLREPQDTSHDTSTLSNTSFNHTRRPQPYSSLELEEIVVQRTRTVREEYKETMRRREGEWEATVHETRRELEGQHQADLSRLRRNHEQEVQNLREHHEGLIEAEQQAGREHQQRISQLRMRLTAEVQRKRELEAEIALSRQSVSQVSVGEGSHSRRTNFAPISTPPAEASPLRLSRNRSTFSAADMSELSPTGGLETSPDDDTESIRDDSDTISGTTEDHDVHSTSSSRPPSPSEDYAATSLYDSLAETDLVEVTGIDRAAGEDGYYDSQESAGSSEPDATASVESISEPHDTSSAPSSPEEKGTSSTQSPSEPRTMPVQEERSSVSPPTIQEIPGAQELAAISESHTNQLYNIDLPSPSMSQDSSAFTLDPPRRSPPVSRATPNSLLFIPPAPQLQMQPAQGGEGDQTTARTTTRDRIQLPALPRLLREGNRLVQELFARDRRPSMR